MIRNIKKWNITDLPFLPNIYKYEVIPSVKDQHEVVNEFLNKTDTYIKLVIQDAKEKIFSDLCIYRQESKERKNHSTRRLWGYKAAGHHWETAPVGV